MTTPKPELRMVAYYYSFGPTGVQEIDLILSAVACAGKASHHTNAWQDDTDPYPGHTGGSPIEWIQNAGRAAADALTRARSGEEQAGRERDEARASELALQTECDRLSGCETERDDARLELEFERRRADLAIRDRKAAEAERDEARRERDGYREGAKRLAECLGGYAHESADHKEILGILALRVDAASYGELPELFGRLESELREAQEHAKECGPLRAEVERLKAQIDRMRQRIQELEEYHG